MQHINLYTLFFLATTLLITQCQSNDQSEQNSNQKTDLKAQYTIRYLESEQELRGQVVFSKEDSINNNATPNLIDVPIYFAGKSMEKKSLPKGIIRFDATIKGPLSHPLSLKFKPLNDKIHKEVDFDMSTVGDYSIQSASKKNGMKLQLSSSIEADESLLFLFTDPNQEARTIIRPGPISDLNVFIPSDALLHFIPGSYRVYAVKSKKIITNKEGVDFQTTIEFYSKENGFELVE